MQIQTPIPNSPPSAWREPLNWSFFGIATYNNHSFLDGNKRTGFLLAATFLELNGRTLTATEESVVEKTLALASGTLTQTRYAGWLKDYSDQV